MYSKEVYGLKVKSDIDCIAKGTAVSVVNENGEPVIKIAKKNGAVAGITLEEYTKGVPNLFGGKISVSIIECADAIAGQTLSIGDLVSQNDNGEFIKSASNYIGVCLNNAQAGGTFQFIKVFIKNSDGGGGGGTEDHAALSNLDYRDSGHTGFASQAEIADLQNNKVDKIAGKELSANDFTDAHKNKTDLIIIDGAGNKYLSDNGTYKTISSGAEDPYILPAASGETLGGVKVGKNLTIDKDGILSSNIVMPEKISLFDLGKKHEYIKTDARYNYFDIYDMKNGFAFINVLLALDRDIEFTTGGFPFVSNISDENIKIIDNVFKKNITYGFDILQVQSETRKLAYLSLSSITKDFNIFLDMSYKQNNIIKITGMYKI